MAGSKVRMPRSALDPLRADASRTEPGREGRVASLQRALMDTLDPGERARVHLELARIALADGRMDGCIRHLREALILDRRLDAARHLLQELGESSRVSADGSGRKTAVKALLGRLRRSR